MQDVPQLLLLKTLSLDLILSIVRSCYFASKKLVFSKEISDSEHQFKLSFWESFLIWELNNMPLRNGYIYDFSWKKNLSLSNQYLDVFKKLENKNWRERFQLYKDIILGGKKIIYCKIPCFLSDLHRRACLVELAEKDDLHDLKSSTDRRHRFVCSMTFTFPLFRNTWKLHLGKEKNEHLTTRNPMELCG